MRKIILFILVLGQMSFVVAQSLVVTGENSFVDDFTTLFKHTLDIENISANAITVRCQKTNLTLPLGAETKYCFANSCYSATSTGPSDSTILSPGQKISYPTDADGFEGDYEAGGDIGITEVKFCFYDVNNPTDETCVTITFNDTTSGNTGFTESISDIGISNFFPNPANGLTNFRFNGT